MGPQYKKLITSSKGHRYEWSKDATFGAPGIASRSKDAPTFVTRS